jgi:hypothetical protein
VAFFSLALIIFPCLSNAGQPEPFIQCNEGLTEPFRLDYGEHTEGCEIDSFTDCDSFEFYASTGDTIRLKSTLVSGGIRFAIQIFDPNGDEIVDVTPPGNYSVDLDIDVTGKYTLRICENGQNHTGSYIAQLEKVPPLYAPKISYDCTSSELVLEDSINHYTDTDFLAFEGLSGTRIEIKATLLSGGLRFHIELWDPSSNKLFDETPPGQFSKELILPESGDYLLAIQDNGQNHTGSYQFAVLCVLGDCPSEPAEGPSEDQSCLDGIDNDCNGLTDLEDPGCDPICPFSLDMKVNGSDYKVTVSPDENTSVTLSLKPCEFENLPVDWWTGALTTFGTFWLNPAGQWTPIMTPFQQGPLVSLPETEILNLDLPIGGYMFFTLIEISPDGVFNPKKGLSVEDNIIVYSKALSSETEAPANIEPIF